MAAKKIGDVGFGEQGANRGQDAAPCLEDFC